MVVQRKWFLFVVMLVFFSISFFIVLPSKVFAASDSGVVKIGIYDNKPKVYRDEKGAASGLFVDILNYIAKQENWQLVYVYGTWEEGLARLEKGEIDIMVDVAVSDERIKLFDFTTETVLSSWGVIFVRKNAHIDSFQDLEGKKIAILKSSVYLGGPEGVDRYIQTFGLNVEFVRVNEYAEVFELINKGEVDAAVVSRVFALTNQKQYPNIKETDMFFSPTELRFALTKGDADNQYLIERLDYWIQKLKDGYEGMYKQVLEHHGLGGMATISKEVIPGWVRLVVLLIASTLFLSWLVIFGLRKTKEITIQKLEEREVLLGSVVEHAPLVMLVVNNQGIITLAEGKALAAVGLKQKNMMGRSIFMQFKQNQVITDLIQRSLSGEEMEVKSEFGEKILRINTSPIYKDGVVVSVVCVGVDLTEEIRLDRAKTEFLSLVSHHLRTLPSEIRWTMELLRPKIEKILAKDEVKHWKSLEQTNMRMIELANTISRASQLELGKLTILPEKFDLPKLVDEEIDKVKEPIKGKSLVLTKHYSGVKDVFLDENQMRFIVSTLLSNAVRYSSSGDSIHIRLSTHGDAFILQVKDTGWGIPKNQQEKVFTKFFRADNVASVDVVGMGLGLYMTKSIIEAYGGKIWFESEEGKGSTFSVTLPRRLSIPIQNKKLALLPVPGKTSPRG